MSSMNGEVITESITHRWQNTTGVKLRSLQSVNNKVGVCNL